MPKFKDIPQLTRPGNYQIDVSWDYFEEYLEDHINKKGGIASLVLNPDFQRGHVWTKEQKIKYVEYKLSGGIGADIIYLNCVGWMDDFKGPFVCVDGLQRISAVIEIMNDKYPVFGYYYSQFEGNVRFCSQAAFKININNLDNKKDVLKWYLEINSSGTPHTEEELNKVSKMIDDLSGGKHERE